MMSLGPFWCSLYLLVGFTSVYAQPQERLIIGRTTGETSLDGEKVRVFGFTNTLSGQVTLPGTTIEVCTGDSIVLDFWNISQGNPHVISMDSILLARKTDEGKLAEEQAVYHMDHGYYHFTAPSPGTYLYYCSENFPLHFRAGMFGVMIVRPQAIQQPKESELLWCSFEMDLVWQAATLGAADSDLTADDLPAYDPQYFLLNGKTFKETAAVNLKGEKNTVPLVLRLVNAGHWQQEISFPKALRIESIGGEKALLQNKRFQKLILASRETVELRLAPFLMEGQYRIKYVFRDPETGRIKHRAYLKIN